MPFNTQCLECNSGGSVFQHSRKKEGSKDVELQADFCFLSQTGEVAGAVEGHRWKTEKTVLDEPQWRSQEQLNTRTLSLPLIWLG